MLTHQEITQLLSYNEVTGDLRWKIDRTGGVKAGDMAGYVNNSGYRMVKIQGELFSAHRIAWFIKHGFWPGELDHKDRNKLNNSLSNLRLCSKSENQINRGRPKNNSSGAKGVVWNKRARKWQAQAGLNGKRYYLGLFIEQREAQEAYNKFCIENHGEFHADDER